MNYGKKGTSRREKQLTSKRAMVGRKFSVIFLKALLVCFLALAVIGGCAGYGIFKGIIDSAPDIDDIDATPTGYLSVVLDKDGNNTATLVASGANRVYVTIDEIPLHTQHAFVAIEDERFYDHNGIDIQGIVRAAFVGISNGFHFTEGASTITQQLLKNNVFTNWTKESSFLERLERKIQEQYLAVELSKSKSKDWVLENYLNTINLGQNTLGVQAAAKRYFGKDVSELTISESAVIAAITQSPSKWNPVSHPENNKERRKKVLTNMKDQGFINQKQYEDAMADDVYSRIQQVNIDYAESNPNSYFVDALIDQVIADLVEYKGYSETQAYKALYQGGLTIYSTQDPAIQSVCDQEMANPENYPQQVMYSFAYRLTVEKADGSIENYSEQSMLRYYREGDEHRAPNPNYNINFSSQEEAAQAIEAYKAEILAAGDKIVENGENVTYTLQPQAAVVIMDQLTGEVKAIVGGRGEKTASRTLNRATATVRQPGSTFKVLAAFAPALDTSGMTLATVQDDAPYTYENGASLRNYDQTYRGFTTIREAITRSVNVVSVKTLTDISPQVGYDYLTNFGFTTLSQNDIGQALALGGITNGVTNLELTAAYAAIANGGTYTKPRLYTKILDHEGSILVDNSPQTRTVLKETTAFLLTSAMQDVVTAGTGTGVNFGSMPIAGKTGTTNSSKDILFAGFTPYYTCVTWGGFDDNMSQSDHDTRYAKNLWRAIMSRLHEGLEYREFQQPEGLTTATVCRKSGKLAVGGLCDADPRGSMITSEYFANGTAPTDYCDHHVSATICAESGMLANEFCPETSRQTGIYITGGSYDSEDGPYLLTEGAQSICTLHTAESILPPVPEIPELPPMPGDGDALEQGDGSNSDNELFQDPEPKPEEDKKPEADQKPEEDKRPDPDDDDLELDDELDSDTLPDFDSSTEEGGSEEDGSKEDASDEN